MAIYKSVTENHLLADENLGNVLYNEAAESVEADKSKKRMAYKESLDAFNKGLEESTKYFTDRVISIDQRAKFLEQVKTGFVTSALTKLIVESSLNPLTTDEQSFLRSIVTEFVVEQGAGNLLTKFKHQNVYLAELGKACRKAYESVVNSINENAPDIDVMHTKDYNFKRDPVEKPQKPMGEVLKLDSHIVDDFYKDVNDSIEPSVTEVIRDKVLDAITDFVEKNRENKLLVQDIIDRTKSKMDTLPKPHGKEDTAQDSLTMGTDTTLPADSTPEPSQENSLALDLASSANYMILEARQNMSRKPFHYMVEYITKEVLNNDSLKSKFIHEGAVDMENIIHKAEIIYTMLETFNTLEVVDSNYIKNYLETLVR